MFAQAFAHFIAAAYRHHDVQEHEVGRVRFDQLERFVAVSRDAHLEPIALQQKLERDEQNSVSQAVPATLAPPNGPGGGGLTVAAASGSQPGAAIAGSDRSRPMHGKRAASDRSGSSRRAGGHRHRRLPSRGPRHPAERAAQRCQRSGATRRSVHTGGGQAVRRRPGRADWCTPRRSWRSSRRR